MEVKSIKGIYTCMTYYIQAKDGIIVFDASIDYETIQQASGNQKVLALLLTHGHFDHIFYTKEYNDQSVPVYIHEADSDCLYTDKNLGIHMGKKVAESKADFFVQQGQTLQISDKKIKVIHTPGHTKGGVCYWVSDIMISGDTLFYHDYGRTDLIGGSEQELTASVRKLLKTVDPKTTVYPGHGKSTTIEEEQKFFTQTIGAIDPQ